MRSLFSASEREAIEKAVKAAESKTSGEIVPAVVPSSASYDWIGYRSAVIGWAAASLVVLWLHLYRPFALEFWEAQAAQALGVLLGWAVSRSHWGMRLFVSAEAMTEEVKQAAHVSFLRHGLMNTRDRTGVLVFVSLRERRVQILADKGISDKVGKSYWKEEALKLVESIQAGHAAEGMITVIQDIGQKLEQHFPRKADDTNELSNSLRSE